LCDWKFKSKSDNQKAHFDDPLLVNSNGWANCST